MAPTADEQFVHLHVHTEYSMLDGAAKLGPLFSEAARMGMPALAMTDHGNVFGAYDFYKQAKAAGVKPIIGMEAYLTPNTSRYDRKRVRWADGGQNDVSGGGAFTHMTLLAETTTGMQNLFRLSSRSSLEGFFYKPRADRELLAEYAEGLIATTGCPSGEIQTWLRIGDYDKAAASAAEFQDMFGRGNFFLELMDHGLDIERAVREGLLRLGHDLDLPMIATNDLHYIRARGRRRPRGAAVRAVGQDDGRPVPVQVRRPRLLPEVAGRDALAVGRQARPARGLRQHPADRRAVQRRVRRDGQPDAALRRPRRAGRAHWFQARSSAAWCAATRAASPTRCGSGPTSRSR